MWALLNFQLPVHSLYSMPNTTAVSVPLLHSEHFWQFTHLHFTAHDTFFFSLQKLAHGTEGEGEGPAAGAVGGMSTLKKLRTTPKKNSAVAACSAV
jgi:hypothetical protein